MDGLVDKNKVGLREALIVPAVIVLLPLIAVLAGAVIIAGIVLVIANAAGIWDGDDFFGMADYEHDSMPWIRPDY